MKVSVSFIKSKYNENKTIELINQTSADYLHVDLMDGLFVNNKNYSFEKIRDFLKNNQKPLDIHFMYKNPILEIKKYIELAPEFITIHLECDDNIEDIIDYIHSKNIKCGISIKPSTKVEDLIPYLNKIEQVLIMSVEPGEGGQSFIIDTIQKLKELKNHRKDYIISIDGGINNETIKYVKDYVDMVVAGSYICLSDDFEKNIKILKN